MTPTPKKKMIFEHCASCGGMLDTGWECGRCSRDWRPYAYPWWQKWFDKVLDFIEVKR